MAPSATTSRCLQPGVFCPAIFCCAVLALVLSASGCASVNKALGKPDPPKQSDPILGEVHPQNTQPYGPTPPAKKDTPADPASKTSALDPLLGPSPTSPAYLASRTKPLPGAQPLAINDGKPAPFQLAGNAQPLGQPTVQPIPRDPAFTNSTWVASPTTSTSASSGGAFAAAPSNFVDPTFAPLTARGITQHRAETQPDGSTRLIALAPQPGGTFRTYDVTARDVASAVQAVVQQIDRP